MFWYGVVCDAFTLSCTPELDVILVNSHGVVAEFGGELADLKSHVESRVRKVLLPLGTRLKNKEMSEGVRSFGTSREDSRYA
jgi:hypothetical protein